MVCGFISRPHYGLTVAFSVYFIRYDSTRPQVRFHGCGTAPHPRPFLEVMVGAARQLDPWRFLAPVVVSPLVTVLSPAFIAGWFVTLWRGSPGDVNTPSSRVWVGVVWSPTVNQYVSLIDGYMEKKYQIKCSNNFFEVVSSCVKCSASCFMLRVWPTTKYSLQSKVLFWVIITNSIHCH